VHPYNNSAFEPVELGASIFVGANKNLWRAVSEFNLSFYGFEDESGDMAIWDGEQVLLTVWFLVVYYLVVLTYSFQR
jgi:prenylcysteine oxidase/farnesylcysteine lyase